MPTYVYECKDCKHTFELFQGINEEKLTQCPECGKESLHRPPQAGSSFEFKGPGFHSTDYGTAKDKGKKGSRRA